MAVSTQIKHKTTNSLELSYSQQEIEHRIFTIRGTQVMLDRDLAELYQIKTIALNQAVKRNVARFPETFRFQLTPSETDELITKCDRFKPLKHSPTTPYAFTEQGVAMLSAVLRSNVAVRLSVQIIEAFVAMRRFIVANAGILQRLDALEQFRIKTKQEIAAIGSNFEALLSRLDDGSVKPIEGVFVEGQVLDARIYLETLIGSAHHEVVLIDSYIDARTFDLLEARKKDVKATIYTETVGRSLQAIAAAHDVQYPGRQIELKSYSNRFHDRFLIIDDDLYHFGASFNELGKRLFAFDRMGLDKNLILSQL